MRRQRVIRRIRYLRNLEIWNMISIPAMLAIVVTQLEIDAWRMMIYAILVMVFLFLQGAIYWDTKHNSLLQHQVQLPASFRTNFVTLRWFNVFFLTLYPIAVTYGVFSGQPFFMTDWWAHSVYAATVLVYINYYHWQISHDNPTDLNYLITHQTLRRSPLRTDLYPITVTITKPIRMQRQSIVFRRESAKTAQLTTMTTPSQSQPIPTAKSQPIPTVSSQSQPIPTVSSQSQPIPTAKSQPIPTVSSQSQPIPTVSSQSQPLSTYEQSLLATYITQPLPIIDDLDNALSASLEEVPETTRTPTSTKKSSSKKSSSSKSVTRTPLKSLKRETKADASPTASIAPKSTRNRSKTKQKND
ncbi:MAG: hypothetical protein ACO3F2_00405 [Roseiflexaceae bacterium]